MSKYVFGSDVNMSDLESFEAKVRGLKKKPKYFVIIRKCWCYCKREFWIEFKRTMKDLKNWWTS